mmetsp:Transcript_8653/g.16589  ORF Transcript_8653/g.16589 Transcript_8653/m.16589 type:complete len:201 (+) Transcript_8653:534-1136(+)
MPEKSHAIGFTFIHSHESYWVLVLEHTGIADTALGGDSSMRAPRFIRHDWRPTLPKQHSPCLVQVMCVALEGLESERLQVAIVGGPHVVDSDQERCSVLRVQLRALCPADLDGAGLLIHHCEDGLVELGIVPNVLLPIPCVADVPLQPPPRDVGGRDASLVEAEPFREFHMDLVANVLACLQRELHQRIDATLCASLVAQ